MEKSENINEIAAALAKAQAEIRGAIKSKSNPYFKSNYADLACVWDACRDPLSKNGLSVVQTPETCDEGVALSTLLMHSSGQWIQSTYRMPIAKKDPQAVGSALTYSRRYALAAIVGIAQEDDDGNAGSGLTAVPTSDAKPKNITSDQAENIKKLCDEAGADVAKFCAYMAIDDIASMPVNKMSEAVKILNKKKQDKNAEQAA